MTGRDSHHYCYDVSYQCWFASEETKIYCYNFNRSNAVVCSHPILACTVPLAIINAAGLERNGWFFLTFIEECCVVIEKNIDKKLANRISYQIWYNRCLKGKFGRGVQICEGGVQSAVTPELRDTESTPSSSLASLEMGWALKQSRSRNLVSLMDKRTTW